MSVDGIAPTAVVKVTLYSREGWSGEHAYVDAVAPLGPVLVATVRSCWTGEVVRVPVNQHSMELVAPPVPAESGGEPR